MHKVTTGLPYWSKLRVLFLVYNRFDCICFRLHIELWHLSRQSDSRRVRWRQGNVGRAEVRRKSEHTDLKTIVIGNTVIRHNRVERKEGARLTASKVVWDRKVFRYVGILDLFWGTGRMAITFISEQLVVLFTLNEILGQMVPSVAGTTHNLRKVLS